MHITFINWSANQLSGNTGLTNEIMNDECVTFAYPIYFGLALPVRTKMSVFKILWLILVFSHVSGFVLKRDTHDGDTDLELQEKSDIKRILQIFRTEHLKKLAQNHLDDLKTKRENEEEEEAPEVLNAEHEEEEESLGLFESSETRRYFDGMDEDIEEEEEPGVDERDLKSNFVGDHGEDIDEVNEEEREIEELVSRSEQEGGDVIDGDVEPVENPELFSLLNSFVDEENGVIKEGSGLNTSYKALMEEMDEHKLTHWQKVEMGIESENPGEEKRNFMTQTNILWPQGLVPYEIDSTFSAQERAIIEGAVAEMANKTCVHFVPKANVTVGYTSFIRFIDDIGCWSYVGRVFPFVQEISLDRGGCVTNTITIHEMCHAIGMMHEQSRGDRDKYISILWDNLQGGRGNRNMWKEQTLNNNNYDHESVLQYSLYAFSKNGKPTMKFSDRRLDFLANSAKGLSFYDAKDITAAYQCTTNNKCPPIHCENSGFQNHKCKCYCPEGLKGDHCELVDTDSNCGGIVSVSFKDQVITSPNYPANYPVGAKCTWLVVANHGQHVEVNIDFLELTDNGRGRCYHWLEIQFNLLAQTGPRRCGSVVGESYVTTMDGLSNKMLLRFDSQFSRDRPASKGFSLTVSQTGSGCLSSPCLKGKCTSAPFGGFICMCSPGFIGVACATPPLNETFSCTFDDADCFLSDSKNDIFDWSRHSGPTPSSKTGPILAQQGNNYLYAEMSSPRRPGDVASMVSKYNLQVLERCLSLWYYMYGKNIDRLSVTMTEMINSKPRELWAASGNQGQQWVQAFVNIPATYDVKIYIDAVRGSSWDSDIAIDSITMTPGVCQNVTTQPLIATTVIPTTATTIPATTSRIPTGPTQPFDPCSPSPCQNGGTCGSNGTCQCSSGFYGPLCDTPESDYYNCTFEKQMSCFLVNATGDDFDWIPHRGTTPSGGTGPRSGYNGPAYIYFEASSPAQQGDKAQLMTTVTFPSMDRCLGFWFHMYGTIVGTLQVSTLSQSTGHLWSLSGNQGNKWLQASINIPGENNLTLMIEAVRGASWSGDIALDDITLTQGQCPVNSTQTTITSTIATTMTSTSPPTTTTPRDPCTYNPCQNGGTCIPNKACQCSQGYAGLLCETPESEFYNCTFESQQSSCFLVDSYNDDYNWIPNTGGTKSSGTGPSHGHSGQTYIYFEASSPTIAGDKARLETITDYNATDRCLRFWYHMYGNGIGVLRVFTASTGVIWWKSGDYGNQWNLAAVNSPSESNLQLTIEAERGSSWMGDIALDDITLTTGLCSQDYCSPSPCKNGGTCVPKSTSYDCNCPPGYSGTTCESTVTVSCPASQNPCLNAGTCMLSGAVSNCTCVSGYTGNLCQTALVVTTSPTPTAQPGTTFTCSFEPTQPCFLQQETLDIFDWKMPWKGTTPSSGTGPSGASEGQYYAYIETSRPRVLGDVALLMSVVLPLEAFCLSFDYNMYGSTMGSLNVLINDNTAGQLAGLFHTMWTRLGDQGSKWKSAAVNIPTTPNLRVYIEAIRGAGYTSDAAIDNVVMAPGNCGCKANPCTNSGTCDDTSGQVACTCAPGFTGSLCETIDSNLVMCSFEDDDYCFLQQEQTDDFDWTIRSAATPSKDTGPPSAFEGSKYAFIETSSPRIPGDAAKVVSRLSLSAKPRCLSLAYHMFGVSTGALKVTQFDASTSTTVWMKSGNQGNAWQTVALDITTMIGSKIVIEGVRGSSWQGDIAIDNIKLKAGICGCLAKPCHNGASCTDNQNATIGFICACPTGYMGTLCEMPDGTLPLTCTFEVGDFCFMDQINHAIDVFDWTIQTGPTKSSGTGPLSAFTGTKYAYIETSSPRVENDNAILTTEMTQLPPMRRCLRFFYHMKGKHIGKLLVLVGERGQENTLWTEKTNKGNQWQRVEVDIPSYQDTVIAIEGVRGNGWSGDIAIDEIELSSGIC